MCNKIISSSFKRKLLLVLILLTLSASSASAHHLGSKRELEVKVYFSQPDKSVSDCSVVGVVTRKISATKQVANAALKLLFAGPTAEEKAKGMQGIERLGDYFIGVTIKNGIAMVNFRHGAEKYLHVTGPFCLQEMVLTPIYKTLKQFSSIKSVEYAIDGKVIEDWDV